MYDEIDLHALTVDEAALKLDDFLHEAYMSGLYEVRVIHGKGTGVLRIEVGRQLARHPLVQSYRRGGRGEGGDGATIVRLSLK